MSAVAVFAISPRMLIQRFAAARSVRKTSFTHNKERVTRKAGRLAKTKPSYSVTEEERKIID